MLSLYESLERLALESSRVGGSVDWVAHTIATCYRDEITMLPWAQTERQRVHGLERKDYSTLVLLVIRDLQTHGRAILVEHNLGDDDTAFDCRMSFAPGHALIIKRAWDGLGESPVWRAFERQIGQVR